MADGSHAVCPTWETPVALQCIQHLVQHSASLMLEQLQNTPLQSFLKTPGRSTWEACLRAAGLGGEGTTPDDAALYLEGLIELETALADQVNLVEETCAGCGEMRRISSTVMVHGVTVPEEASDLQTLLAAEEARLDPEITVQCPQCLCGDGIPRKQNL